MIDFRKNIIKNFRIGEFRATFVLRHRFEKVEETEQISHDIEWNQLQISAWFEKRMSIGTRHTGKKLFSKKNHSPTYTLGIKLIVFKFWLDFSWRVLVFGEEKNRRREPAREEPGQALGSVDIQIVEGSIREK